MTIKPSNYTFRKNLLTTQNAKTSKGEALGYLTGILYLAPASNSSWNVCALADEAQCADACLFTAGRGAMNSVQTARMNKTAFYFLDRDLFMSTLYSNIERLIERADRLGLTLLVRLNGTSDIKWENVPFIHNGVHYANVMTAFPSVQFYDYTKIPNRLNVPANYDLTYSYSGVLSYQKYVAKAVEAGMRLAVVFRSIDIIPAKFMGMDVVGGDFSDVRHTEPRGVVVALYAKGKAKNDRSGFVVDTERKIFALQPVFA